jgi:hypothetical protein
MSNQVIECWNCHRKFEVNLERKPPVPIYRGIEPYTGATTGDTKMEEVRHTCPFCGKDNMIRIPKEK